jgi:hypothetical protein
VGYTIKELSQVENARTNFVFLGKRLKREEHRLLGYQYGGINPIFVYWHEFFNHIDILKFMTNRAGNLSIFCSHTDILCKKQQQQLSNIIVMLI